MPHLETHRKVTLASNQNARDSMAATNVLCGHCKNTTSPHRNHFCDGFEHELGTGSPQKTRRRNTLNPAPRNDHDIGCIEKGQFEYLNGQDRHARRKGDSGFEFCLSKTPPPISIEAV